MPESLIRQIALVAIEGAVPMGELAVVAAALARQAARDLAPLWGVQAVVSCFAAFGDVPPGYWPVVVIDDDVVDSGSGVHQTRLGQPIGFVEAGPSWPITASHEILEMLVDPFGNRLVAGYSPADVSNRVEFLLEICDPCQGPEHHYSVDGVPVSDFCTPNYFDPVAATGVRYSYTGQVVAPRSLLPSGYLTWRDPATEHWTQQRSAADGTTSLHDLGTAPPNGLALRAFIDQQSPPMRQLSGARREATSDDRRRQSVVRAARANAREWERVLRELKLKKRRSNPRRGSR